MRFLICFIFVLLIACSGYKVSNYEKMADKITAKTAKKLEKERELILIGTGGGMMHNIRMMAMSFVYKHEIDVDEGRTLLIAALGEYIEAVNTNEEIRPYLANYPFDPKNIEIRIFIHNPDNSNVEEGKISVISAINGILKYDADEGYGYKRIHRETYEEALEKIAQSYQREAA